MSKLVLVLNCGSSSLKFAIIDAADGTAHVSGLAECFNLENARIKWKYNGEKHQANLGAGAAHAQAIRFIVDSVLSEAPHLKSELIAVGHRVVHGGERFTESVVINEDVLAGIDACSTLAPLHNPAGLLGIEAATKAFPELPQVAVFDTAFHQSMPQHAYMYALPYDLYQEHGIRRYGMHGTSHRFVAAEAANYVGKAANEVNVITAHLGNGASVAAVQAGKCVDTSMGLTPLEGLMMGTRCGDIDPSIPHHLVTKLGYSVDAMNDLLNKRSGLLGIYGKTSDCRDIEEAYVAGDERATLALDMFCYRLAKYIASYMVSTGPVDAIVFTGGIGENSDIIRAKVLNHLAVFGYKVEEQRNLDARFGGDGIITADNSPVAIVIPTNEEWVIARDAQALVSA